MTTEKVKLEFKKLYFLNEELDLHTLEEYQDKLLEELVGSHDIKSMIEFQELYPYLSTTYGIKCLEYQRKIQPLFQFPDLTVKSGKVEKLSPRVHYYNNIHVEQGGYIQIPENSSQWCILWVTGNVIIDGFVFGIKQKIGPRIIKGYTPDGKLIEHEYLNQAMGGDGGYGGTSRGGSINVQGGAGANGSNSFGGGGGSAGGAIIQGPSSTGGSGGINAIDWRGAQPASIGGQTGGKGGDGGKLGTFTNGGLLFIYCNKFSCSGYIHLYGEHGQDGGEGYPGSEGGPRGQFGGSGGGGGSPGGEGGKFILVANEKPDQFYLNLNGGIGGKRGNIGKYPNGAQPGSKGEDGQSNAPDFYTVAQWNRT